MLRSRLVLMGADCGDGCRIRIDMHRVRFLHGARNGQRETLSLKYGMQIVYVLRLFLCSRQTHVYANIHTQYTYIYTREHALN